MNYGDQQSYPLQIFTFLYAFFMQRLTLQTITHGWIWAYRKGLIYLRIFTHNINKRNFMISCCVYTKSIEISVSWAVQIIRHSRMSISQLRNRKSIICLQVTTWPIAKTVSKSAWVFLRVVFEAPLKKLNYNENISKKKN